MDLRDWISRFEMKVCEKWDCLD